MVNGSQDWFTWDIWNLTNNVKEAINNSALTLVLVGSTSQMEKYVKESKDSEFIIATEFGLLQKLERATENKKIYKAHDNPICYNMKKNTLESLKHVIENQPKEFLVQVPEEIAEKNRVLLNEMIKNSKNLMIDRRKIKQKIDEWFEIPRIILKKLEEDVGIAFKEMYRVIKPGGKE